MQSVKDSLFDLERHRRRLEENISELQQSLRHWRTWDAEYEALKEEVQTSPDSSPADLERIQDSFEGELVNRKEVGEIFGPKGQRSKDQIINVLERRVDYVTKSIESLQRQLETAENKHAAASIISQPDAQDDEGQPITEIVEELDDDDNIVSYRLNRPGESLSHVREALEKAGIKDLPSGEGEEGEETGQDTPSSTRHTIGDSSSSQQHSSAPKSNPQPKVSTTESTPADKPAKKGVSFSDDTKPATENEPPKSRNAVRVENIMQSAKDQESILKAEPVIPEDEDPEDAALRRDMLNYTMGEMGAVVAELDLEEGDSDDWEYSDEGFDEDEDDDDDAEDKYGRYTGRVVTDDYRQRMLELEQKLGIQSRFTQDQKVEKADDDDSESDDDRIGRIVIKQSPEPSSSVSQAAPAEPTSTILKEKQTGKPGAKKGVRFADSLDIAPSSPPQAPAAIREKKQDVVEPLTDIVERSSANNSVESKPARKASRFKKTRNEPLPTRSMPQGPLDIPNAFRTEEPPQVPTGPEGATIADTLVERETVARPSADDEAEDLVDPGELADQHQRLRRKFIQRQGGFLKEDDSPIQPLDETDEGPAPVSRFRAARLSRQ